jgi:hypothetical protein
MTYTQLPSVKMFLKYFVKSTAKLQDEVQLSLQKQRHGVHFVQSNLMQSAQMFSKITPASEAIGLPR